LPWSFVQQIEVFTPILLVLSRAVQGSQIRETAPER